MIKLLISGAIAIVVFISCAKLESFIYKNETAINYSHKLSRNRISRLIVYVVMLLILVIVSWSFRGNLLLNYFCYAFAFKLLYFVILTVCNFIYAKLPKSLKSKDNDFAYMDSVILLNLLAFVMLGTIYSILSEKELLYPSTGAIGSMIMLMVMLSYVKDSYNLFAEYERKDEKSLYSIIRNRKWGIIDKIFLSYHCIKKYITAIFKEPKILGINLFYIAMYIFTLIINVKRF